MKILQVYVPAALVVVLSLALFNPEERLPDGAFWKSASARAVRAQVAEGALVKASD